MPLALCGSRVSLHGESPDHSRADSAARELPVSLLLLLLLLCSLLLSVPQGMLAPRRLGRAGALSAPAAGRFSC